MDKGFTRKNILDKVTLKGLLRLNVMEDDLNVEWVSILIWPLGSSELVATGVRAQATCTGTPSIQTTDCYY